MARGLLVATGVVATVTGALLLAGGAAVAATFGTDGRVSTEPARVQGTGVAVLVDGLTVDAGGLPVPDGVGSLSLTARSTDGGPIFLATARDDDLDRYLTGAPYDVVASLSPGGTATTRPVPGTLRPQPPVDAAIWTASAVGAPARLPARVPDGTTLVVMRPDAEAGVDADLVVTLEVDRAWPAALVALGAGLVLLVLGLVLLRLGLRRPATSARHAAPPASAAAGTVVPGAVVAPAAERPAEPSVPLQVDTDSAVALDRPSVPGPEIVATSSDDATDSTDSADSSDAARTTAAVAEAAGPPPPGTVGGAEPGTTQDGPHAAPEGATDATPDAAPPVEPGPAASGA